MSCFLAMLESLGRSSISMSNDPGDSTYIIRVFGREVREFDIQLFEQRIMHDLHRSVDVVRDQNMIAALEHTHEGKVNGGEPRWIEHAIVSTLERIDDTLEGPVSVEPGDAI